MTGGEIGKWRHLIISHCQGDGVDIGYGGYSLMPSAITIDLPRKYSHGPDPQHLHGNGVNLHWFADGVLDYVFSSHMFEDIPVKDKLNVLREWYRVIRIGGKIVLLLPDEQRYRKVSPTRNKHHTDPNFCLDTVVGLAKQLPPGAVIIEAVNLFEDRAGNPDYNFLVVIRKVCQDNRLGKNKKG